MTKEQIIDTVRKAAEARQINEGESLAIFQTMGGGLCEPSYSGDIFNHRIRTEFIYNNIEWLVEVTACDERITLHKITKQPLKHIKMLNTNNGVLVEINAMNAPTIERSASGAWGLFNNEKRIASERLRDDLLKPAHTFKKCLSIINRELRTQFKNAVLLYTFPSAYLTINEALKYEYKKDFGTPPTPAESVKLLTQARHCWEGLQHVGIVPKDENFLDHYCFCSSSALHGYYFPNSRGAVRCFIFNKWDEIKIVLKDED